MKDYKRQKMCCKFMSNYQKTVNNIHNFRIIRGKNQNKLFNFLKGIKEAKEGTKKYDKYKKINARNESKVFAITIQVNEQNKLYDVLSLGKYLYTVCKSCAQQNGKYKLKTKGQIKVYQVSANKKKAVLAIYISNQIK